MTIIGAIFFILGMVYYFGYWALALRHQEIPLDHSYEIVGLLYFILAFIIHYGESKGNG